MSQTNAIILRIRADQADEFERMFREEEVPIWDDFAKRGGLLAASLTRASYGTEEERWQKKGVVEYILIAVLSGMPAHSEHDVTYPGTGGRAISWSGWFGYRASERGSWGSSWKRTKRRRQIALKPTVRG